MCQGFRKGTIAMVVVAVALAAWICVIWWQDARTSKRFEAQQDLDREVKLERYDSREREGPEVMRKAE